MTHDTADVLAWQVRAVGLAEPVREYRFHPTRRWRFDLAWPDRFVAVEVDGGTWTGGRHVRGGGFAEDYIKVAEATVEGWAVLRFTLGQVDDGTALGYLERLLVTEGVRT